jgi:hypothetical protein
MQLEILKHYQCVDDILVFDDCSSEAARLKELADTYSSDFAQTMERQGHHPGDVCAFITGLLWAKEKNLDYLVKISRRFIILDDWMTELLKILIKEKTETTVSFPLHTRRRGQKVRCISTCWIALHVDSWCDNMLDDIRHVYNTAYDGHIEKRFMHMSRMLDTKMGKKRALPYYLFDVYKEKQKESLWKLNANPKLYFEISTQLGLSYCESDFTNNLGYWYS